MPPRSNKVLKAATKKTVDPYNIDNILDPPVQKSKTRKIVVPPSSAALHKAEAARAKAAKSKASIGRKTTIADASLSDQSEEKPAGAGSEDSDDFGDVLKNYEASQHH